VTNEVKASGAYAEYRGGRFLILFGGPDWVALRAEPGVEIPDAFDRGELRLAPGHVDPWAKVPSSALDGVVDVDVSATLSGHYVSVRQGWRDGRFKVWFVGPPAVATELRLEGDQYMGWTSLIDPADLKDIHVEETRRA
jgi:hypothetical protein